MRMVTMGVRVHENGEVSIVAVPDDSDEAVAAERMTPQRLRAFQVEILRAVREAYRLDGDLAPPRSGSLA